MGAKKAPKSGSDNPRIAVVIETLNSAMTPVMPAVYAVIP